MWSEDLPVSTSCLLLVPDKVRELERNCSETLEQRDRVVLCVIIKKLRTFLVVQWLRVCLPIQGVWVLFLVWEDSTCCRATKPVCCNY